MGNLSDAMQSMSDEIRSATESRRAAFRQLMEDIGVGLSEIRSDTHNLMERCHQEDTERKGAMGEMLGDFRKADNERKADVSELERNTKDMVGDLRQANSELKTTLREMVGEFASDHSQAHQIWTGTPKEKMAPRAVARPKAAVKEAKKKPEVEAAPSDEEKVLEVISRYPEGIRLVDIGNELGMDWRILIGPSKSLVDAGRVEKIENMYYPKKEE